MKILITGSAGFIGSALTIKMLELGHEVIGIDNHNDYYSTLLKEDRLARHLNHDNYEHIRIDIADTKVVLDIFKTYELQCVVIVLHYFKSKLSLENTFKNDW